MHLVLSVLASHFWEEVLEGVLEDGQLPTLLAAEASVRRLGGGVGVGGM